MKITREGIVATVIVLGWCTSVFIGGITLYHKYFLMPAINSVAKERDEALGHQVLLIVNKNFTSSYKAIPLDIRKPHQQEKLEQYEDFTQWHNDFYRQAFEQGLVIPLQPPE